MVWYLGFVFIISVAELGVGMGKDGIRLAMYLMIVDSDVRYISFIILFSQLLYMFESFYDK